MQICVRTVGGGGGYRSPVTPEDRRWNTDKSAKRSKRMCRRQGELERARERGCSHPERWSGRDA